MEEESDEVHEPLDTFGEAASDMDMSESLAASTKAPSASSTQNEKLYNIEGILNPRMARAERKRRKKSSKTVEKNKNDGNGSDYDFEVDYKEENGDSDAELMTGIE